jgi:hypothetical protein
VGCFHKNRPCHLLLTCVTGRGAISFLAPLTHLAVNWARSHNAGLLLVERALTVFTTPFGKDLASAVSLLNARTTFSITSSPGTPLVKDAVNGARNDLACTILLQFLCAFDATVQRLLDNGSSVVLDARSTCWQAFLEATPLRVCAIHRTWVWVTWNVPLEVFWAWLATIGRKNSDYTILELLSSAA